MRPAAGVFRGTRVRYSAAEAAEREESDPFRFPRFRDARSGSDSKSATTAVSGPALWRRVEFPLFAEPHAAEGTRFAYAVFLLNKDLEQLLNAHGLLAVGPRTRCRTLNGCSRRGRKSSRRISRTTTHAREDACRRNESVRAPRGGLRNRPRPRRGGGVV